MKVLCSILAASKFGIFFKVKYFKDEILEYLKFLKKLIVPSIVKDMEEQKLSHTVGMDIK